MGEYEPNDSRNVTGANNQMGANEGGKGSQTGQHWQQAGQQGQQQGQQGQQDQQDQQQGQQGQKLGHGQDPGWRTQAPSQQQAGQQGGASGQQQQFDSSSGGQMGGPGDTGIGGGGQSNLHQGLREHMEVIGADGVHVGTIDAIEGDRIKLTRRDSSSGIEGSRHEGHHHYLPLGLVAGIEGDQVRLSANADVAYGMEQEKGE